MIEDHSKSSSESIDDNLKHSESASTNKTSIENVKTAGYLDESMYTQLYQTYGSSGPAEIERAFIDHNQLLTSDSTTLNLTESYYRLYNDADYSSSSNHNNDVGITGSCNNSTFLYRPCELEEPGQDFLDLTYRNDNERMENEKNDNFKGEDVKTYVTIYNNLTDIYYHEENQHDSSQQHHIARHETLNDEHLFQQQNINHHLSEIGEEIQGGRINISNNQGDISRLSESDMIRINDHEEHYAENGVFNEFNQLAGENVLWTNNDHDRMSPGLVLLPDQSNSSYNNIEEPDEQESSFNGNSLFNVSTNICLICGDKATGKHYGAQSCDGCKGFFRRSVRKSHQYQCRYNKDCTIDKDKRNQCRFCRLKKCFNVGMKKCAVQNERDKISTRKNITYNSLEKHLRLEMKELINADHKARCFFPDFYSTLIQDMRNVENFARDSFQIPMAICKSQDFLLYWLGEIQCFNAISIEEKKMLTDIKLPELILLDAILQKETKKTLNINSNGNLVQNQKSAFSSNENHNIYMDLLNLITDLANRITSQLLVPLEELMLDPDEVLALKALVIFDPNCGLILGSSRDLLSSIRTNLQIELQNYMNEKTYMAEGRFGNSLLLLPNLRDLGVRLQHIVKIFSNLESEYQIKNVN